MTTRTALLLALAAALLWRWLRRGSNRVRVRPAADSVSFENMLEEADPEQLRWMKERGEL